ncbi:MAG: hypothetical protein AB1584_04870 [Pseudomonadota bacterium]
MITTGGLIAGAQALAESELKKQAIKYLKDSVIEKWSGYRADKFFKAFLEEVRKESDSRYDSADLNDMLRKVAANDKQSSAIFDAYRKVALSASKDIGPMIIGVLTAIIVLEDREAAIDEELIFQAAETLNDLDFNNLVNWWSRKDKRVIEERGSLKIFVKYGPHQPPGISMGRQASGIDDVPLDVVSDVGIYALKLKNLGMLTELRVPRANPAVAGATEYFVIASPACRRLCEIAERVKSVEV